MTRRESVALIGLMGIILVMTGFAAGTPNETSVLDDLAPFILPALLTLYFLLVLAYSHDIIAMLSSFFLASSKQEGRQRSLLASIVPWAIVVAVILLLIRIRPQLPILSALQRVAGFFASLGAQSQHMSSILSPHVSPITPFLLYYAVIIFGGIVVLSFWLCLRGFQVAFSSTRSFSEPTREVRKETVQIVKQALTDLKSDGKYQSVIIKCYKQMCTLLSGHGFTIRVDQTPREFANDVSTKLQLGAEAMRGLTFLFEEARYSDHDIDDAKRAGAVNELGLLQQALTGKNG